MTKKTTAALLFFLLLNLFGYTQTLDWGMNLGGHIDDAPGGIHKVPGGLILISSLDKIGKYDTDGNQIWRFSFFDHLHERFSITSSDVDEKGNIYVTLNLNRRQEFQMEVGGITFRGGPNLVKIDPNGEVLWSRKIGGANVRVRYQNRKVYVTGKFQGHININDEVELESKKYYNCYSWIYEYGADIFIARFSDMGVLEKAVQYGNDYHDNPTAMEVDAAGNIFLTGGHEEYACVISFTFILRYDNDLNQVWEKQITTEERHEYLLNPRNLFLSENGKLYVVATNYYGIETEDFQIPFVGQWTFSLLEYDPVTSDFLRLNSYVKGTTNPGNNLHIQDHKDDLIIFASSNTPLTFANFDFVPRERQENLLLFKVNKKDFTSEYLTHFEAEVPESSVTFLADNPGRILVDGNKLYLTAAFEASPLNMLGASIPNNSGNNDFDILLAKLDISSITDPEDDLDDDGDGVVNYRDYCPETPAGTAVDQYGCSGLQKDTDEDGVINRKDECPNTRAGAVVNDVGCELLILPADNFRVSATSETCAGGRNATILIEAADTSYQYFASLGGEDELLPFTDALEITGLAAGSYTLCITAEGFPEYRKCFDLVIERPESLEVYSVINEKQTMLELQLKGGELYTIRHNARTITTAAGKISLSLDEGINKISVQTGKECQGIYEEVIITGNKIRLYPNPVEEFFTVDLGNFPGIPSSVEIYSVGANLVKSLEVDANSRSILIDASGLPPGTYFVRVNLDSGSETFKMLKR